MSNGSGTGLSGNVLTANTNYSTLLVAFDSPLNYATVKFAFTGNLSSNSATLLAYDGMGNMVLTQTVGGNSGSLTVGSLDGTTFFSRISINFSVFSNGVLNLEDLAVDPVPEIDASSTVGVFALLGTACVMIRSRRPHRTS